MFDFIEEALHQVPFFIAVPIHFPRIFIIRFRRDGVRCLLSRNPMPNAFWAVGFVTNNMASRKIKPLKQIDRWNGIIDVPPREKKSEGIP